MRHLKQYIFSAALMAGLGLVSSSCSDFLDNEALGVENLDGYFSNETNCKKQLNGCYQSVLWTGGWWQIQKFMLLSEMCTDDAWMGNTTQDAGDYRDNAYYTGNTYNAGNGCQNFWQYRYKGILRCNLCITNIPNAPIDETVKKRLVAEAKFIRAYEYFDLARNFGGVPIMLGMQMPTEVEGVTRNTLEEVYAQVEKDLTEAIADLPESYDGADVGRVTKGAAQGLLGKVYLYQEKYSEAEAQLQAVINSGRYQLLPDFGEVWAIDHNNSKESLFEVQTKYDQTYNLGISLSYVCGNRSDGGWSWMQPTSNLEKAFLDAGDNIRLKWTIIKNDATEVPGDPSITEDNPFPPTSNRENLPGESKSGRTSRKVYIPKDSRWTTYPDDKNPLNYRILRYADVLLMYAEVENALHKDAEARKALNKVRARVNLPAVTSSGKQLRDAIRLERRLELAMEDNRLYDLRRWKDDNGKAAICNVMGPNGSFVKYNLETSTDKQEKDNQKEPSNKGVDFKENRDVLFPIPPTEITLSGGSIKQNPGY